MGREVKRVPLDFDWPKNKVWKGFLTPDDLHGEPCDDCDGTGQTHAGWWVQKLAYLVGMLASDIADQKRGRPMHPWLATLGNGHGRWTGEGSFRQWEIVRPSEDILDFMAKLCDTTPERLLEPFGGSSQSYGVMKALMDASGVGFECKTCEGHGEHEVYPGQRASREAWTPDSPPEGPGWQLWETVSEGSPISPVFDTPEKLALWMSSPSYVWGATKTAADRPTYEQALAFIRAGWAPTGIITAEHGVEQGDKHVGRTNVDAELADTESLKDASE